MISEPINKYILVVIKITISKSFNYYIMSNDEKNKKNPKWPNWVPPKPNQGCLLIA
jgi:hypothetical protein